MRENEESGGFKFAIALLTAFGTIVFVSYNYFKNNAVSNNLYAIIVGVITALLTSSILLIAYIFVKGYSIEVQSPAKKTWENFASYIYQIVLWTGAITLLLIVGVYLVIIISSAWASVIIISFFMVFLVILTRFKPFLIDLKKLVVSILILFSLIIWLYSYTPILSYMQGHVTIEMNNIYYKNGEPIPLSIEVTGRNDKTSIELYQLNLTHPIATLELETEHNSSKNLNRENSTLIGNAFFSGKYYVFINTTELREGYYELVYTRPRDGYKYGKSFYLLNASLLNTSKK